MGAIDVDGVRTALEQGSPLQARWLLHGTPLAFHFALARRPLRHFRESDFVATDVRPEWRSLLLFGESDYADGGGARDYLCLDEHTGKVHGLDVEREGDPLFLFNSDAGRFIATFVLFDSAIRRGSPQLDDLAGKAETIDADAFHTSEWLLLVEHLRETSF